MPAKQCML
uniref:Uncharacterized protein n=1 Tax=Anguilla anguilla TaxID=7936 RepID=A0A0E9W400_ANGAN